jgi:predicted nucleotidyltransferase
MPNFSLFLSKFPYNIDHFMLFRYYESFNFGKRLNSYEKMNRNQNDIDQLVKSVVEAVQPLKIILFGSAARGNATADSDVDLLVVMPEGIHRRETARYLYKLLGETGIPVDILVATPDDLKRHKDNIGLIYRTVLQEGREVYAA